MTLVRGDIAMQASFEADFAGPINKKDRVDTLEDMYALPFKWAGMKVYVRYEATLHDTTGKTYELKPQETLTMDDMGTPVPDYLYGKQIGHWQPLGEGGASSFADLAGAPRDNASLSAELSTIEQNISAQQQAAAAQAARLDEAETVLVGHDTTLQNHSTELERIEAKADQNHTAALSEFSDYLRIDATHIAGYLKGDPTGTTPPVGVEKIPVADIDQFAANVQGTILTALGLGSDAAPVTGDSIKQAVEKLAYLVTNFAAKVRNVKAIPTANLEFSGIRTLGTATIPDIDFAISLTKTESTAGTNRAFNNSMSLRNAVRGLPIRFTINSRNAGDTLGGFLNTNGNIQVTLNGIANTTVTVDQVGHIFIPGVRNEIEVQMVDDNVFEVFIDPKVF